MEFTKENLKLYLVDDGYEVWIGRNESEVISAVCEENGFESDEFSVEEMTEEEAKEIYILDPDDRDKDSENIIEYVNSRQWNSPERVCGTDY